MPLPQDQISSATPMGANVVAGGGVTFRLWAPHAHAVHVVGEFNGRVADDNSLLVKDAATGHWTGFVANAAAGQRYMFHVAGDGGERLKRDPYARELTPHEWPNSECLIVDPRAYRWRSDGYRTPYFEDFVLYQLHVGAFDGPDRPHRVGKFLDAALRIPHLASLGVTSVQLLPVDEFQGEHSLGYNGTDYFSPEMDYGIDDAAELQAYLDRVNPLFAARGAAPLTIAEARGSYAQLKVLVDLLHLHGIGVVFDVVYNHAGGGFDEKSLYYLDMQADHGPANSLYFSTSGWAGGLVFDFDKPEVRQFLIDNARFYIDEYRADGLRYDEVSVIDHLSSAGWRFCQDLTRSVRETRASVLQNAEYWPVNTQVVRGVAAGGAGFDTTQHDALRIAVRDAIRSASFGGDGALDMTAIGAALSLDGFAFPWQIVPCVENHDVVRRGREPRIPALADGADARSWYARSRSRVATALVLTSPGIPQLFMGQELLEEKEWDDSLDPSTLVSWSGLDAGDPTVADFVRFVRDLIAVRWRFDALRRGGARVLHVHDANRILAFARDERAVVVVSLNDRTFQNYRLPFPAAGEWPEVLNSDVYDHFPNPMAAGNGGRVVAGDDRVASLTIPANALLVFAR
jgi:1,4-alpha-glucan branching enzyme